MHTITKNYLYNAAYQLLVLLCPIVTAPYLSRVLGAENLGIYSYISASGNIVITLSQLGLYAYGSRQIAYVREPFGREPDFGVTSVNYNLSELWARGIPPSRI